MLRGLEPVVTSFRGVDLSLGQLGPYSSRIDSSGGDVQAGLVEAGDVDASSVLHGTQMNGGELNGLVAVGSELANTTDEVSFREGLLHEQQLQQQRYQNEQMKIRFNQLHSEQSQNYYDPRMIHQQEHAQQEDQQQVSMNQHLQQHQHLQMHMQGSNFSGFDVAPISSPVMMFDRTTSQQHGTDETQRSNDFYQLQHQRHLLQAQHEQHANQLHQEQQQQLLLQQQQQQQQQHYHHQQQHYQQQHYHQQQQQYQYLSQNDEQMQQTQHLQNLQAYQQRLEQQQIYQQQMYQHRMEQHQHHQQYQQHQYQQEEQQRQVELMQLHHLQSSQSDVSFNQLSRQDSVEHNSSTVIGGDGKGGETIGFQAGVLGEQVSTTIHHREGPRATASRNYLHSHTDRVETRAIETHRERREQSMKLLRARSIANHTDSSAIVDSQVLSQEELQSQQLALLMMLPATVSASEFDNINQGDTPQHHQEQQLSLLNMGGIVRTTSLPPFSQGSINDADSSYSQQLSQTNLSQPPLSQTEVQLLPLN
jgi:hypothetical protein